MKRLLLPALLGLSSASAQLQVTVPTTACQPNTTPILGVAVQSVFEGDYGFTAANAVSASLKRAGFKVTVDYDYQVLDKASILISGQVDHWKNASGESSSRVGDVHLEITDLSTDEHVLILNQKAAWIVLNAPTLDAFTKDLTEVLLKRYCQVPKGA